jgi:two-component system, chemotaxis family, chemotaxis protein CheY
MAKTVLVVDDSQSVRLIVKSALSGAGYRVVEAADGKEALALLNGQAFNLAICDLNMPHVNGIEFVQTVKKMPQYKFLPVLMLTTETHDEKKQMGKEAGARAWMLKPFSPTQLIKAVDKLCT